MINLNLLRFSIFTLAFLKIIAISFALTLSRELCPYKDSQHHTL